MQLWDEARKKRLRGNLQREIAVQRQVSHMFLIPQTSRMEQVRENLAALWSTPRATDEPHEGLFSPAERAPRRLGLSFTTSVALHCAAGLTLLYVPLSFLDTSADALRNVALIELPPQREILYLPVLKSPGPGGKPGAGDKPGTPRRGGSPRVDLRLTAVSNPPAPDNKTQTILQPPSPTAERIPMDVALPDIVLGKMEVPAPPPEPKREVAITALRRAEPKPPPQVAPKPVREDPQIPQATAALLTTTAPPVPNLTPQLPLPPPPKVAVALVRAAPASRGEASSAPSAAVGREVEAPPATVAGAGGAIELLSLSIHPAPFGGPLTVPPGIREGEFSVSPEGGGPGALGGAADGTPGAGSSGRPGAGGDSSTAVGTGQSGGGGGATGTRGSVSISPKEGVIAAGSLTPVLARWIYPVTELPPTQRTGLLISSGPTGGGGLRVYGVLRGGKVYTTYLPMPNKNWVLEYSLVPASGADARSSAVTISPEEGLTPPRADRRFDFYRPVLEPPRNTRTIILSGRIGEDGAVEDVKVLQKVQDDADQLAVAAFSQWKFLPAMRQGQPVAVEILVGIPAAGPRMADPAGGGPPEVAAQ